MSGQEISSGGEQPRQFNFEFRDSKNKVINTSISVDFVKDLQFAVNTEYIKTHTTEYQLNKKIVVKVLGEQRYEFKIGNQKFFYAKEKESETFTIIREKIENRSIFQRFTDLFSTITQLLFGKGRTPASGSRAPADAVKQDYTKLRRCLETGRSFLSTDPKAPLQSDLQGAIENCRAIEKALDARDPEAALKNLSEEWTLKITRHLGEGVSFIIPTGYLNGEGNLQPVMVRFYKKEGEVYVEIYNDNPEVGDKLDPIQIRKLQLENKFPTETQIKEQLNVIHPFLNILIPPAPKASALPKLPKSDIAFQEQLYPAVREKLTEKMGLPEAVKDKGEIAPPAQGLTFKAVMAQVDAVTDFKVVESKEKVQSTSTTDEQRIVKWFDHLLGAENKNLNPIEKTSLLYYMTELSLKKQMGAIDNSMPIEKRLRAYEECISQLNHLSNKIAPSLLGKPDAIVLLPPSLVKLKQECEKKASEIKATMRTQRQKGQTKILTKAHTTEMKVPVEMPKASAKGLEALIEVKPVAINAEWNTQFTQFSESLSSERQKAFQAGKLL